MSWNIEQSRVDSYNSPVPSPLEVAEHERQVELARLLDDIVGIKLRANAQFELLDYFKKSFEEPAWRQQNVPGLRFRYDNYAFTDADALILNFMMRYLNPRRIVEVGSGFSTLAMLDTIDASPQKQVSLTCVEPHPERLFNLLADRSEALSRMDLRIKRVQEVDRKCFDNLETNDILFIDSSHILKTGSDTAFLLLEIIPRLRKGVYVHFHDICFPFEYPKGWVNSEHPWNEAYAVKAFLLFNDSFEIVLFNSFVQRFHREWLAENLPRFSMPGSCSSLWIRKTV